MKVFLLLFVLMVGMAAAAQRGWTDGFSPRANQSYVVEDGNLSARNQLFIPRYDDTTDANDNILDDTLGQIIYTYHPHAFWGRVYSGGNMWIQIPMTPVTTYTASEGLQLNGVNFEFGGLVSSPAYLTTSRNILANRKMFIFGQGIPGAALWQHADSAYSPFQFLSDDTLLVNKATNDPTTALNPLSGLFARRTMYYADGILKIQKTYGHYFGQTWNWKDSVVAMTEGGDYNVGVVAEQSFNPRGSGKQVVRVAHGNGTDLLPYYGVPTFMSNTILRSTVGTNYIYTRGWLVGISSYLITANTDTVERFSFYNTNMFMSGTSYTKKLFGLDFQHYLPGVANDSSWGIWDQYGYRHWLMGNTVIGPKFDSSVTGYKLKVNGAMYMRGLFQGFQGTDVASTAGVMTLVGSATAGNIYEITGTNTITAINNTNLKNGYEVTLLFTSTATLTDGTANSGAAIGMELAGNTNFTASAGDAVTLVLSEIGGTQRFREKCRSDN